MDVQWREEHRYTSSKTNGTSKSICLWTTHTCKCNYELKGICQFNGFFRSGWYKVMPKILTHNLKNAQMHYHDKVAKPSTWPWICFKVTKPSLNMGTRQVPLWRLGFGFIRLMNFYELSKKIWVITLVSNKSCTICAQNSFCFCDMSFGTNFAKISHQNLLNNIWVLVSNFIWASLIKSYTKTFSSFK